MTAPTASSGTPETPPNPETPGSSTPPSGAPTPSAPWKAPASPDVPQHLWGKSSEEILAYASQVPVQTSPQNQLPAMPTDDQFFQSPTKSAEAVAQNVAARFAPQVQANATMAQDVVKFMATQKFAADFAKWGPEIEAKVNQVEPQYRSASLYENAVKLVRGDHVQEIVAEEMRKQAALSSPGERSSGTPGGTYTGGGKVIDFDAIPSHLREQFKAQGITEATILEFCQESKTAPADWMKQAVSDQVFAAQAGGPPSLRPEKLGITAGSNRRWEK